MKFCSKCGNQLFDEAVICPSCGCSTAPQNTQASNDGVSRESTDGKETSTLANCALLFAFLMPIVGVIMGIIGLVKYRTREFRTRCTTSIIVSIIFWIVSAVIMSSLMYI